MISSTTKRADYEGTGITGPFSFTFKVFSAVDLRVTITDTVAATTTLLEYPRDFKIAGVATGNEPFGAGGFVTLEEPLAVGKHLTILRSPEQTQPHSFANAGPFFPKAHEDAFDRVTMLIQGMQDDVSRAIKQNVASGDGETNLVMPPGKSFNLVGWDLNGKQLANYDQNFKEAATQIFTNGVDFTTGVTLILNLAQSPGTPANALVFFDGVYQDHSKFSIVNNVITFNAPIVATKVEVAYRRTLDVSSQLLFDHVGSQRIDFIASGVGAVTRDLRSRLRETISVFDFGVVGDGVVDDTVNMQRALDAGAAQDKVVRGSNAIVKISGPLSMLGPGLVFDHAVHGGSGGPGIKVTGTGYTALTCGPSTTIHDFCVSVYGTGNAANGILFQNPQSSFIRYTRVFNLNGFGVKINRSWDNFWGTVSTEQCGNSAEYAFSVNGNGDTSNMSHFAHLQVELSNQKAILIDPFTLSCVFADIHSERSTAAVGVLTWHLSGAGTQYNMGRFSSLNSGATLNMTGEDNTYIAFRVEGDIASLANADANTTQTIIGCNFNGAFGCLGTVGQIVVHGGRLVTCNADPNLKVVGAVILTLSCGFSQNPPNPFLELFYLCTISTLVSNSTLAAATFVDCTIAECNDLLQGYTILVRTTVTSASAPIALGTNGLGRLDAKDAVINTNVTYNNGSPIRATGFTRFVGTVNNGDGGNRDLLFGPNVTVSGSSTGVIGAPTGGAHVQGDRHFNALPNEQAPATAFALVGGAAAPSKYIVNGWICTAAGTPGTWLESRTLTGN